MKSSLRLLAVASAVLLCQCVASVSHGGTARAASMPAVAAGPDIQITASPAASSVIIPGPLRSFLRMAAISQQVSPEEVLPLLARNVYLRGYDNGSPTVFLTLVDRYIHQARELQILAGPTSTIRVDGCDDAGTLIQILGYRLRPGCGQKNFSLETANPERAFLTIDSGFPLVELEEALQKGTPFIYSYPASQVPVLFREGDWTTLSTNSRRSSGSIVDAILNDQAVARLYWALAKTDAETQLALKRSPGLRGLLPLVGVLDFYGNQLSTRNGRVMVPGGAAAEPEWKELVGASPESPVEFLPRLLAKDGGWLVAYYDVLARIPQEEQRHLTAAPRMKRLYESFRAGGAGPNVVRGVFRKSPDILVLYTRLQWEPNGDLHVPGDLAVWREILRQQGSKMVREEVKHGKLERPEQLLEALTSLSCVESETGPLQTYLTLSELDRGRQPESRLSVDTVRVLAGGFAKFNSWYLVFTEFPELNDDSITKFVTIASTIEKTSDQALRGNALGAFQANVGLWQIMARQGEIPHTELNTSWQKMVEQFAAISSSPQLFDATRSSLEGLMLAAGGGGSGSGGATSQDEIVDLLAGPRQVSTDGQRVHLALEERMRLVMEDQRLASLSTLFALSDGLKDMEQGKGNGDALLPLAAELREFDLPRPIFTNTEKVIWAPTNYTNHHAELQVRTNLAKVIKAPASRAQLEIARGQLTPFLRDTLVGLNYAYYEPPGAQMLHHNPLFVRSHDFMGVSIIGVDRLWGAPMVLGTGMPAGGGAYLMGSLADLSYALASSEEDFIAPENVQALIWKELVPDLLVSATLPRWWSVTPNELHAVTLYQRSGEEILMASVGDAQMQQRVVEIFSENMAPQRLERVERSLHQADDAAAMMPRIMPAETSYLAAEYRKRFPDEPVVWGPASRELEDLRGRYPTEVSWQRVSKDFGVPHPTLARTNGLDLLNVKPFPFFGSYSNRLFGESWESSNLYWARLADEMGYSPVALNSLIPELTRHTITKIFATEPEDWPATFRAVQETGKEFRQGKIAALPLAAGSAAASVQAVADSTAR